MKTVLLLITSVIVFSTCKKEGTIYCAPCPPDLANYRAVVEFDTSKTNGFKPEELDTVYIRRYDSSMNLLDSSIVTSVYWDGYRNGNRIQGMDFDNLDSRTPKAAVYYELAIKNYPSKYTFSKFDVSYIDENPRIHCNCPQSWIRKMKVNDSLITKLPYLIKK